MTIWISKKIKINPWSWHLKKVYLKRTVFPLYLFIAFMFSLFFYIKWRGKIFDFTNMTEVISDIMVFGSVIIISMYFYYRSSNIDGRIYDSLITLKERVEEGKKRNRVDYELLEELKKFRDILKVLVRGTSRFDPFSFQHIKEMHIEIDVFFSSLYTSLYQRYLKNKNYQLSTVNDERMEEVNESPERPIEIDLVLIESFIRDLGNVLYVTSRMFPKWLIDIIGLKEFFQKQNMIIKKYIGIGTIDKIRREIEEHYVKEEKYPKKITSFEYAISIIITGTITTFLPTILNYLANVFSRFLAFWLLLN